MREKECPVERTVSSRDFFYEKNLFSVKTAILDRMKNGQIKIKMLKAKCGDFLTTNHYA